MQGLSSACEEMKGKKNEKSRRIWSLKEEETLLSALKDLAHKGWKSDNGFRSGYLIVLEDSMKKAFSETDIRDTPHINSKIHVWKKNYGTLFTILSTSGIGWNETDKMIDAPDDDWEEVVKNDPNARCMRNKSWPYYDDWCEIFGKDRANGHNAEGFIDAVQNIFYQTRPNNEKDDIELEDILRSDFEDIKSNSSIKHIGGSFEKKNSKKRKTVDNSENLTEVMKQFADKTDSRLGEITKCLTVAFDVTTATNDVFEALDGFAWLTIEAKVLVAKKLVNNPQELKLFFKLPDDAKSILVKMMLS
ncbi:uncharacterized protein [Henckelia pumila]|uniref:uncharacterized protein n=1 Tax=Henckelia pumila TaxID=405737 RepID=UPI003C6DCC5A